MKVVSLFSGGKDSTFAVWKAVQRGDEIVSLLALEPENPDSYMFHHPNIQWTRLQAEAMGFPIRIVPIKGEKEKELADLEKALRQFPGIEGVTAGALASQYQMSRVEKIAEKLGLKALSPAWHQDTREYWDELFRDGFRVIVTKVACEGLGRVWLGREITPKVFQELKSLSEKYRFHLAFEGGEAETFVVDCPLFKKRIEVKESEVSWDGDSGALTIKKAILNKK